MSQVTSLSVAIPAEALIESPINYQQEDGLPDKNVFLPVTDDSIFSDEMHIKQGVEVVATAWYRNGDDRSERASERNINEDYARFENRKSIILTTSPEEELVVQRQAIEKVLITIDRIEAAHRTKGFRQSYFTLGLLNCLLVGYAFGSVPQHFWIIYLIECFYFIPSKFMNMVRAKPLCQVFYYFDFCWIMNFLGVISVTSVLISSLVGGFKLSNEFRKNLYMTTFGIACGPLLGATAALPFVAFLFHDVNTMTNLIIHMMPPMLLYTLHWHADAVQESYKDFFDLSYLDDITFFPIGADQASSWTKWWMMFWPPLGLGSIAGNSFFIYICWFVPYVCWMIMIGLNLPNKRKNDPPKYDTVFHSLWRTGPCLVFGKVVWQRTTEESQRQMKDDNYELKDFMLYMTLHACMVVASIPTLGLLCYVCVWTHALLIFGIVAICAHRGSKRYTYYVTQMYGRNVRKQLQMTQASSQDLL